MKEARFNFGENWKDYLSRSLDSERVKIARESLKRDFDVKDFSGKSFLDIGSGSGLFSLGAYQLDADHVFSFDYDPNSVEATRRLRKAAGSPECWEVKQGDILDAEFVKGISSADYVYSWGVLHHTGQLWSAMDNVLDLTTPDGYLFVAVYNNMKYRKVTNGKITSKDWLKIKRAYNLSPRVLQKGFEKIFVMLWSLLMYKRGTTPSREIEKNKKDRGMSFREDVRDWLGGLPYEYATAGEVCEYILNNSDFVLEHIRTVEDTGLNRFRFHNDTKIIQ
jgi:2-polyprenyl-6-hydroxyphenyl methylase/3-demethylubiquinone-9 3-methyltransferase